jgi:hypothetical protein
MLSIVLQCSSLRACALEQWIGGSDCHNRIAHSGHACLQHDSVVVHGERSAGGIPACRCEVPQTPIKVVKAGSVIAPLQIVHSTPLLLDSALLMCVVHLAAPVTMQTDPPFHLPLLR